MCPVPEKFCDWCGGGNDGDSVHLCVQCLDVEEWCGGDMGAAWEVVNGGAA